MGKILDKYKCFERYYESADTIEKLEYLIGQMHEQYYGISPYGRQINKNITRNYLLDLLKKAESKLIKLKENIEQ